MKAADYPLDKYNIPYICGETRKSFREGKNDGERQRRRDDADQWSGEIKSL